MSHAKVNFGVKLRKYSKTESHKEDQSFEMLLNETIRKKEI